MIASPALPSSQSPGAVPHLFGRHRCSSGDLGLTPIAFRRLPFQPREASEERLPDAFVELQRGTEQFGHHLLRDVVTGGTQSAGREHGTGSAKRLCHGITDFVSAVGDRGPARDPHPMCGEAGRDLGAVGVDGHPEQQLGADGDELDVHWE